MSACAPPVTTSSNTFWFTCFIENVLTTSRAEHHTSLFPQFLWGEPSLITWDVSSLLFGTRLRHKQGFKRRKKTSNSIWKTKLFYLFLFDVTKISEISPNVVFSLLEETYQALCRELKQDINLKGMYYAKCTFWCLLYINMCPRCVRELTNAPFTPTRFQGRFGAGAWKAQFFPVHTAAEPHFHYTASIGMARPR